MTYNLRTFYTLLITQVLSMLGSRMTGFALGIWIFTETGNTTPLVLVPLFTILPYMLLSSVAGVFVDRFSRKWLIILGDAGQAIPTLVLLLLFSTDAFAVWHLYLAVITQSFFGLMQGPAMTASITMLVPDSHRNIANALGQITQPMAGLIAPPIAGLLYTVIDVSGIIALDLLTFIIAVIVVSTLTIPQPQKTQKPKTDDSDTESDSSMWTELKEAFGFLATRRGLLLVSLYATFLNFITVGAFPLILPYVLLMTDSEPFVGVIQGVFSFGLIAGGLSTTLLPSKFSRVRVSMMGMVVAGVGLAVFGTVRTPIALVLVGFVMALPYKMFNALFMSILQAKIPPDMQGRVFSLLTQVATFAMPITYIVTGPLIDEILEPAVGGSGWSVFAPLLGSEAGAGIGLYMLFCGSLLAIGSLVVYAVPSVRNLERELPDYLPEAESETVPDQPITEGVPIAEPAS